MKLLAARCLFISALSCAALQAGTASAADTRHLSFVTGDWPPYIFENGGSVDAERPGYSVEIVNAVMKAMEIKFSYTSMPFPRQIKETEQGTYDAMVVVYAEEAPNLVFPNEQIGMSQNCFFALPGGDWRYTGLDSLSGQSLAIVEGYVYGEVDTYIAENRDSFPAILGSELDHMGRLTKLVELGRADAFLQDKEVARYSFESTGQAGNFENVGCLEEIPVVIGFSPKNDQTPQLIAEFDRTFAKLRAAGEIESILSRYGVEDWK